MTSRGWHASAAVIAAALGAALAGLPAAAARAAPPAMLPAPVSLYDDGRLAARRGQPIVLLFSLPQCAFCDEVRQNYLLPLVRDVPPAQQVVLREVRIGDSAGLVGFDRRRTTHGALAQQYGARFSPTVMVLDGNGTLLAPPLVGGDTVGLYGGHLDNALAQAARTLARRAPAPKAVR